MKTFLIYNLDTPEDPVGVCEAIREDWARYEAADKLNLHPDNLYAMDISVDWQPIEKNSGPQNPPHIPTLDEWLKDDTGCWMNYE